MYPVLFELFGVHVTSYGVSKALAALAAWWVLRAEFGRLGWDREVAGSLVLWGTLSGFMGAKLYYLAEHAGQLSLHHLGGSGFTWYGGFLAGAVAFTVVARRNGLPLAATASASVAPLSLAYGIGRLGCLLAGDGTYGRPTDLPWGMAFPDGMVPTMVPVHPTPLYEALAAFVIAALLWHVRTRWRPIAIVGAYASLSGLARFVVEIVRINDPVVFGLTQPQLWSLALAVTGGVLLIVAARTSRTTGAPTPVLRQP